MEYFNSLENSKVLIERSEPPIALWRIWLHRHRTRKQLHALLIGDPMRVNDDLGLSTEVAMAEISKPFWRR